ncbi:Dermal papilla-derived protein 6-like protein, partial [Stegodyphus mimosarum]
MNGLKVYKTIMQIFCKEECNMSVLCCDGLSTELMYGLKSHDKVRILDVYSDPLGWNNSNSIALLSVEKFEEQFTNFEGLICFYSLSSFLIHNGIEEMYKVLHRMLRNNSNLQILALLYCDVHNRRDINLLERIATTVLEVPLDADNTLLSTVHYSSGKVSSKSVEYKISQNYEFNLFSDIKITNKAAPVKKPDPTANLTFNLRLRDEEKEARNRIQLPYTKVQS